MAIVLIAFKGSKKNGKEYYDSIPTACVNGVRGEALMMVAILILRRYALIVNCADAVRQPE